MNIILNGTMSSPIASNPVMNNTGTTNVVPYTQKSGSSFITQLSVRDAWLIIVVCLCFFCLSLYILARICSINTNSERRHRSGYKYKIIFLSLLFVCCLTRSLVNVGNFVTRSMTFLDLNLLYLPCYSIFIYFFGKLTSQNEWTYTLAKFLMLLLNVFAYFSYIFINVYYRDSTPPVDMLTISTFLCLILISLVQICMVVMINKRAALIPKYTKERKTFRNISKRAIFITSLMVFLFFLRYMHYLIYLWGLLDRLFQSNDYRMTVESAFYLVAEFIPIQIIVILFSHKKITVFTNDFGPEEPREWTRRMYQNDEYGTFIDEENTNSEYGSFNPNLRQKLLVNEFRRQLF
ncbi:unnamed protein product [Moneuplotes crassus]|uniref:THH1/TOM1/TOM3 domain-containing protein n=1 Tax=Euplotes crassus TaxID=5936 RepID=A0AAD2CVC8_EUPCR|nr:unnamed protein product [Moneuplotes crassus]